jgi:hypothetical protein
MACAAAAAWGAMRGLTGVNHLVDLLTAFCIVTLAAELAMVPTVFTRGAGVAAVSQAGLVGTILHLFLTISLAGVACLTHVVVARGTFIYLLAAFYWFSLVMVVMASVRVIRQTAQRNKPARST